LHFDFIEFSAMKIAMNIEIEAKFLNIERNDMRAKLVAAGFVCTLPDFLMRRVVFDMPGTQMDTWGRVRDEGNKITMTIKRTNDINSVTGTEEIEVCVDDFEDAAKFLEACGLIRRSYQETRREKWQRDNVEVVLDEWPAVPPFCEIEASTEDQVRAAATELGFDWKDALFGAVGSVYERSGINRHIINRHPVITFDNVNEIFGLAGKTA
jgi:adenylate cyclase, class 2